MGKYWLLVAGCWMLVGCVTAVPAPTPTIPTLSPISQPPPSLTPAPPHPVTPPLTPPADTGWQLLRPGLERRLMNVNDEQERPFETIYLLRLEPALYEMRVAYHPGQPQTLAAWQAETEALIVVNGGFFTEAFEATGVVIVEGQASGVSYVDFGGMLAITEDGPELRWLGERPYTPTEPLPYALQSFPMLVKPGGQLGYPQEDGQPARRTAIGMDTNGRFLILLSREGNFTLHQLSLWLTTSDLALDVALNLDGGPSSGLILAVPHEELFAFSPLPAVITIYPR